MAIVKSKSVDVVTGEETVIYMTVSEEAAHLAFVANQAVRDEALDEINRLETIPRRIREELAALGSQYATDEEAAIEAQRLILNGDGE